MPHIDGEYYTDKQLLFCRRYAKHLSGVRAAKEAKYQAETYTSFASIASENLKKQKIRKLVDKYLDEQTLTDEEIFKELSSIARAEHTQFMNKYGKLNFEKVKEVGLDRNIKTIEVTETYGGGIKTKYKFYNRRQALKDIKKLRDRAPDVQVTVNTISFEGAIEKAYGEKALEKYKEEHGVED